MIDLNNSKQLLSNALWHVFTDNVYTCRGKKRFRILLYAFAFGCVNINDLRCIFPYEHLSDNEYPVAKLRKDWISILNYLSSSSCGLLEKTSDESFCITNKGKTALLSHLKKIDILKDEDLGAFKNLGKLIKVNTLHAGNIGRSVISFIKNVKCSILIGPAFDYNGNIIVKTSFDKASSLKDLNPDALIKSSCMDECIFIEADSCSEKDHAIITKFNRYINFFDKKGNDEILSTIYFSIWNKKYEDDIFVNYAPELKGLLSVYHYVTDILCLDYTFYEFLSPFINYCGDDQVLASYTNLLDGLDFDKNNIRTEQDFISVFLKKHLMMFCKKKYFNSRANKLFNTVKTTETLKHLCLNGLRVVCSPIYAQDFFHKFIFFEEPAYRKIAEYIIKIDFPECSIIDFYPMKKITSNRTGEYFVLRNVFSILTKKGNVVYVSIENISDDIGGYFRIENIINRSIFSDFNNTYFYSIFNDFVYDFSDRFKSISSHDSLNIKTLFASSLSFPF